MHDHHGHGVRQQGARRVALVLVLSTAYMAAEAVGGWLTGSLALLADAGHMLSDVAALVLTLFAFWIAQRPATAQRTYGHTRAEILAALAQGVALVAVALLIVVEAIERLGAPTSVNGLGMLSIAVGGLAVNLAGLWILGGSRKHNLNLRGAWLHVASDALGSVGAIAAGLAVWSLGLTWADPVASLVIAVLVVASAWNLLRDALEILMETAPRHLEVDAIRLALAGLPGVGDVHDLHVWTIGSGEVSLSCHVVARAADPGALLLRVRDELARRFGIAHATVQIEPESFLEGVPSSLADEACGQACEPAAEEGLPARSRA